VSQGLSHTTAPCRKPGARRVDLPAPAPPQPAQAPRPGLQRASGSLVDRGQDPLVLVDRVCPRFVFLLKSVAIGWWRTAAARR